MIRLERVTHAYPDSRQASIRDVSLDLDRGELVLVTGRSGSGKTTLLRAMNGLVPRFSGGDFSGEVTVEGASTLKAKPRDLAPLVGFVGQDPELASVVDRVEDDIAFALENLGLAPQAMRKRVEETLDALGIAHLRGRELESLSGGERQRVAIAGALSAMPRYLVLDEPTSQLDPQSAEEVIGSILRLRDEYGIGIALAEHRLERVLQYADRLVHMNEGLCEVGDPAEMIAETGLGPPMVALGEALHISPPPIDLRAARKLVAALQLDGHPSRTSIPETGDVVANLRGVSVSLNGTRALNGIDLHLHEGEVIALLGRNGSGKTTLMRAISGLARPSAGKRHVTASIGLVPQNPDAILFRETVGQEIATSLRLNGKRPSSGDIGEVAETFEIGEFLNCNPRDLSGGQRTMVAIAAALAARPHIILLDEPTRGMDLLWKKKLCQLLVTWRLEGKTVVIATHDVELAAMVATRVVLLSEGEIFLDGPPEVALSGSLTFSTQMNKIFGDPCILTVEDALQALGRS